VPHFEKMLYDQAGLVRAYLHAWQATGEARWLQVVEETVGYVLTELASPGGGLCSAQDADSEGEEGRFYVWTAVEVAAAVGQERAAVALDWYGVSDVNDLLAGPNRKNYAVAWLGDQQNIAAIAKQVSPLTYVRPGLPPIISIHGDGDDVVPYSHAVRLHEALNKAGVKNELVTIYGGKHGWFSDKETLAAYDKIWKFLDANVPGLKLDATAKGK